MKAKKEEKKSANMDYGFLDIGRDKANRLLCLFLPKNGLDLVVFFFLPCMGGEGDTQYNVETSNASCVSQPSSGSWGFFVK